MSKHDRSVVQVAQNIFSAAVRSVQADGVLTEDVLDSVGQRSLKSYRRVFVFSIGKAGLAMAAVVDSLWGDLIDTGIAVIPVDYRETLPEQYDMPTRFEIIEAGHPQPDAGSGRAGRALLETAQDASEDDLVVVLISGGGSALTAAPREPVSLDDLRRVNELLLGSGASIHEVNAVRKHLTAAGGGQLAEAAHPAEVVALAVSDVVGDDLDVIASGPTVPDPTSFSDAREVLERYSIWTEVPESARRRISDGIEGNCDETPGPEAECFATCETRLIATNRTALEAAAEEAEKQDLRVELHDEQIEGEARDVGRELVGRAGDDSGGARCFLWGGETTVTLKGDGKGGRNQELALAAGLEMETRGMQGIILSGGTDGIDGPTDAAGAWSSASQIEDAHRSATEPEEYLDRNDSYHFFEQIDGLVITGPTHTNVMDVVILITSI